MKKQFEKAIKCVIPKGASRNETIRTHAKCRPNRLLHNHDHGSIYVYRKGKNYTIDQVHGRSASNVVCKRFVKVCFKKFVKTPVLEKLCSII